MATIVPVSYVPSIGETAGVIWQVLLKNKGPMTMAKLVKTIGEPRDTAMLALGWLAREGKVAIDDKGHSREISLR